MILSRRAALGGFALLAACGSKEPVLYTLLPVPGDPRRGGPRQVTVREISLARILDRQQIVRNAGAVRLDVAGNDWWGEPLEAMTPRVLVENLGQRLPQASVVASTGAISFSGDLTVEVNLQQLGLTAPGELTLAAQVSINPRESVRRTVTRRFVLTQPVTGTDTPAFVTAASAAFGQLADAIAGMLVAG